MNRKQDIELLEQYLAGTASAEELAALESRLAEDAALRARLVEAVAIDAQLGRMQFKVPAQQRRRWLWPSVGAVAALLLLAIGLWVFTAARPTAEVITGHVAGQLRYGEVVRATTATELKLDERARVTLTPGAALKLLRPAEGVKQQVSLEAGRAAFRVTHEPGAFRVDTAQGSIVTQGTTFLVRADGKSTLVAVTEGRIQTITGAGEGRRQTVSRGNLETLSVGETARVRTTSARLERVDEVAGQIYLAKGEGRTSAPIRIAPDALLLRDRALATLAELRTGMQLKIYMDEAGDVIGAVARGGSIAGTITVVDAAARTLTLVSGKESAKRTELRVPDDAVLMVDGQMVELADLPRDVAAQVQLTTDGAAVFELTIGRIDRERAR